MNRYAPSDPNLPNPIDPATGHRSPFPAGFNGCMACGSADHVFQGCPNRDAPGAKQAFFRNLFAHKPNLRKNPPKPHEIVPGFVPQSPAPPPVQAFTTHAPVHPPITYHQQPMGLRYSPASQAAISEMCSPLPLPPYPSAQLYAPPAPPVPMFIAAPPSVVTADHSAITHQVPVGPTLSATQPPTVQFQPPASSSNSNSTPEKRTRLFVNVVKTFQNHAHSRTPALPPMPIAIDNGLPHVGFALGNEGNSSVVLSGLADTCGALNTGYKTYHQWIMSEHPEIVFEYLEFDSATPFEPVRLGGAVLEKEDLQDSSHGHLTAIIRYYTPYTGTDGSAMVISFALGEDVSVNTIYGLTFLKNLDAKLCLGTNLLRSDYLACDFPITYKAVDRGLPIGSQFDPNQSARNNASHPSAPQRASPSPSVAGSATAIDDSSAGFLRRTLQPTI
jgi:hypothetical protein